MPRPDVDQLDEQIERLRTGGTLSENEVKVLCDKVSINGGEKLMVIVPHNLHRRVGLRSQPECINIFFVNIYEISHANAVFIIISAISPRPKKSYKKNQMYSP